VSKSVQALIVGGGPTGLAVAYALQNDTLLLEKESAVGGLCRSIEHDGGVFDIGGHSFHTPHTEVYKLVQELLPGGLYEQQRDARVSFRGTLIPYPFQKHFEALPFADVVAECERGLQNIGSDGEAPSNFEEFIVRKFGQGIADHFMLPYNRKLWARDISKISCEWTSERVAGARGERERFDTSGGMRKPLQADTKVGYPRTGGFEEIYKAFVPRIPAIELNSEVVMIDPKNRIAVTADGRNYEWEFLVSTMPLPVLVRVVEGTPPEIVDAADSLEYMSLRVELLQTNRWLETPVQRIYVADPEVPPHKIALNHNSSDALRQAGCQAIMAEVSRSPEKPVDVEEIAPKTVDFLTELAILQSPDDIKWTGHVDVKYAYPVYTHARPGLVASIKGWLERHNIYTAGRFGDWEYINSDKCVNKGIELGRKVRARHPALGKGVAAS